MKQLIKTLTFAFACLALLGCCSACKDKNKKPDKNSNSVSNESVSAPDTSVESGENDVETSENSASNHSHYFVPTTVQPTCTTVGVTTYACSCGEKYMMEIPALGHTEVIDSAVAPTCTTDGKTEGKHCLVCNEVFTAQTTIPALGHTEVIDSAVTPTCTTSGKTEGKYCSVCKTVLVAQATIAPLGHTAVVINGIAPTCTTSGKTEGKYCSVCQETLVAQTSKPATGHSFVKKGYCVCGLFVGTLGLVYTKYDTYAEVTGYQGTDTEVYIADTYEGLPVTRIGAGAFDSCSRLTSVVIPDSVTTIGAGAFGYCWRLTSITVNENNTAYCSMDGNLYTKDGKTLIQYAIGKTATSFTIPDSVTTIGDSAFYNCDNLTSVAIPDSVTTIHNSAFYSCSSLTSVVIPDSVTTIGDSAFSWCSNLTSVYYKGTAKNWANISIGEYNDDLTNATRYYYSETQPTTEGKYWHYVDGEIVVW